MDGIEIRDVGFGLLDCGSKSGFIDGRRMIGRFLYRWVYDGE